MAALGLDPDSVTYSLGDFGLAGCPSPAQVTLSAKNKRKEYLPLP